MHPTDLVKPDDPDGKITFFAAEALRGVGGLVFDVLRDRFVNELGRRHCVTEEMWRNKPPFCLALNKTGSDEVAWHCKHYTGRAVMKFYESGADMGVSVSKMEKSIEAHYQASLKTAKDPAGGPFPAYPFGESWDAGSGKTDSEKKFLYHNVISGAVQQERLLDMCTETTDSEELHFWIAWCLVVLLECMCHSLDSVSCSWATGFGAQCCSYESCFASALTETPAHP